MGRAVAKRRRHRGRGSLSGLLPSRVAASAVLAGLIGLAAGQQDDSSAAAPASCQGCSATWLVGALINILGNVTINLGQNLMKLGHTKRELLVAEAVEKGDPENSVPKTRVWKCGASLFILGNILNFGSFALAAQSLLAALGCVQFVTNVVFASFVNGEKASSMQLAGTVCVVVGTSLTVIFGVHTSEDYDGDDLKALYREPVYLVYAGMQLCLCIVFYFLYRKGRESAEPGSESSERAKACFRAVTPFAFAIFSGMIGTQSLLFGKMLSSMLAELLQGGVHVLADFFPWLIILLLVATAVFWTGQMNKGFKMFDILVIMPAMQLVWTLSGILTGLVYFQEYKDLVDHAPDKWLGLWSPGPAQDGFSAALCTALFSLGIGSILAGAVLMADRTKRYLPEGDGVEPLMAYGDRTQSWVPADVPQLSITVPVPPNSSMTEQQQPSYTGSFGALKRMKTQVLDAVSEVIQNAREQGELIVGGDPAKRRQNSSLVQNWSIVGGVPLHFGSSAPRGPSSLRPARSGGQTSLRFPSYSPPDDRPPGMDSGLPVMVGTVQTVATAMDDDTDGGGPAVEMGATAEDRPPVFAS